MRVLMVIVLLLLEISQIVPVFSSAVTPVNCQWKVFGAWSECDGCSKTQTRTRTPEIYAQFGGLACTGNAFEKRSCVPTKGCPIEDGCGDRFRCFSGQCISSSLVCNGDHDCEEDSADETQCEDKKKVCDIDKYPPNTELTGVGFDAITEELKKNVIHTKSFGGKCRKVFSGDSKEFYRLSENVLTYTFQVSVKNDFNYDFYNSSWSYVTHSETHVRVKGEKLDIYSSSKQEKEKSHQLMVIQNEVEVAQFINNHPEFLTLAEQFWKELFNLPSVYVYSDYRKLIENYGTHFLQSGSLGGQYKVLFYMDTEKMNQEGVTRTDFEKCTTTTKRFLFFKRTKTECKKLADVLQSSSGSNSQEIRGSPYVIGGEPKFVSGLSYFNLNNPAGNEAQYTSWAGSVTKLPSIIKQKLTPLYELVKEVPCSSVKRYFLKQAIEEYMNENNACKCKPCTNKGQPTVVGTECICLCKPYTFGSACQLGFLAQEDPGVIDGSWSCWSTWSTCLKGSGGRRMRSRSCNNPQPSGGGKSCIGDSVENQQCEDDELEHFRTVEPHCFDVSIIPSEFCPSPPLLDNGFVQDASTSYPVGRSIVYTCKDGYTLIGDPVAKCKEDFKWHIDAMKCQRIVCARPVLPGDIKSVPEQDFYHIGEKIRISCPAELNLDGPATILCTSSLNWYPNIQSIQCTRKAPAVTPKPAERKCQPWEKLQNSICSCKMPPECGSSFAVCAIDGRNNKNVLLTVCKMHALACLGRKYTLTQDANCEFPAATERSCGLCHLWEVCAEKTNTCACREAKACGDGGISICVQVNGNIRKQTMTECEAGILKCQRENVTIVSISPCEV